MIGKKNYKDRMVIDTKIHFGKPCVAGTRIPVENVLELVQENIPFKEIIKIFFAEMYKKDEKGYERFFCVCLTKTYAIPLAWQCQRVGKYH